VVAQFLNKGQEAEIEASNEVSIIINFAAIKMLKLQRWLKPSFLRPT
jgi:hypothetical protein